MDYFIKPPELTILKFIYSRNNNCRLSDIKRELVSYIPGINDVIESMLIRSDIVNDGNGISIKDDIIIGYLEEYDNSGIDYIIANNLDLAIIKFLYEINCPVTLRAFPKIIIEHSPSTSTSIDNSHNVYDYILYKSAIRNYIENVTKKNELALKPAGRTYYEHILKQEQRNSEDKKLSREVDRLTAINLSFQNDNSELRKKLDESLLSLSKAQEKDIPINAVDRKTVIYWQVATGVLGIVAFLLKVFGVKGWL